MNIPRSTAIRLVRCGTVVGATVGRLLNSPTAITNDDHALHHAGAYRLAGPGTLGPDVRTGADGSASRSVANELGLVAYAAIAALLAAAGAGVCGAVRDVVHHLSDLRPHERRQRSCGHEGLGHPAHGAALAGLDCGVWAEPGGRVADRPGVLVGRAGRAAGRGAIG